MPRFSGNVGFGLPSEVVDGVWQDGIREHTYKGSIERTFLSNREADKVNDDISVSHQVRILADAYALENYHLIKYVNWAGTLYKVSTIEVHRPRLVLYLGGLYDGPRPSNSP